MASFWQDGPDAGNASGPPRCFSGDKKQILRCAQDDKSGCAQDDKDYCTVIVRIACPLKTIGESRRATAPSA